MGYIPHFEAMEEVNVPAGAYKDITLHDGSVIRLETISESGMQWQLLVRFTAETNAKRHRFAYFEGPGLHYMKT